MMKKYTLFVLACFFIINFSVGQTFSSLKYTHQNKNIENIQEQFNQWAAENDFLDLKYSKPFHRWLWFNQSRIPTDTITPLAKYYFDAHQQIAKMKRTKNAADNGWIPKGPLNTVPSPDPQSIHNIGRLNCIAFHPTEENIFWVAAPQGGIWKTTDGGQNWIPMGDDLPILRVSDIAVDPVDPDILYICLGDYGYMMAINYNIGRPTHYGLGVYKSIDGGLTWEPTGLALQIEQKISSLMRRVFINPENTDELVAAGVSGIYRSSDAGESWTQVNNDHIFDFEQQPYNFRTIYATTFDIIGGISSVMKSTDFGETWNILNTGIPSNNSVFRIEVAVAPSDSNYVYAACGGFDDAFYAFYQSTDAGETWEMKSDSSEVNIFGQLNGDPSNKLAQSSYDLWVMVDPDDPERVFTGAMNIWGSDNGGDTWNIISLGIYWFGESIHFDHHFVKQNPLDEKYYFCCDGGLYRTNELIMADMTTFDSCFNNNLLNPECFEFETEWEDLSGGLVITEFYRLGLSKNNPGYVIAGSQDNCTFYKNDIDEWINVTNGDGMEAMIHPDDPDIIYAANQFGILYKSVNGGQTMSPSPLTGTILNQEGLGVWITPFIMDQQTPNTIYAGFRNLWKSEAGGYGWNKISEFPNMPGYGAPKPIWDVALAPTNADVIYVAKQPYPYAGIQFTGELWKTFDGGETWENISSGLPLFYSYPNDIAVGSDPNMVYVALSGFDDGDKIYKSENGGEDWTNISGSIPNIPVTSVVCQLGSQKDDIYVGTDLGVYHLNHDFTDWQLYNENLPNVIVNELEINYVQSKLVAATYGRGVWEVDLVNPVTGIIEEDKLFESSQINVSPNPSNGIFNIEIDGQYKGDVAVDVINILGGNEYNQTYLLKDRNSQIAIDIGGVAGGIYFVRIASPNKSKVIKVLID
jgi:photosystem II stability/assembly factor-like uncharacterized protein